MVVFISENIKERTSYVSTHIMSNSQIIHSDIHKIWQVNRLGNDDTCVTAPIN